MDLGKKISSAVGTVFEKAGDGCELGYNMFLSAGNVSQAEERLKKAKQGIDYNMAAGGEQGRFDPTSEEGLAIIAQAEERVLKATEAREQAVAAWDKIYKWIGSDGSEENPGQDNDASLG